MLSCYIETMPIPIVDSIIILTFAPEILNNKIVTKHIILTLNAIARINEAGQLWEMAKRQTSRKVTGAYYFKAYAILQQELGKNNAITCELRKEMLK